MPDKDFKTHEELVDILCNRGINVESDLQRNQIIEILKRENYYNVINGYKELFLDETSVPNNEKYKPGTSFEEIYALYKFDREIRHIYLKYLLQIENSFKSVLAHEFSRLYGHDNYLKLENFHVGPSTNKKELQRIATKKKLNLSIDKVRINYLSSQENIKEIIKLMGDIQNEIARQMGKNHQAVKHYMSEYGYIPFWVLVNVLTFGKITTFYKLMKPMDKMTVAKNFGVDSNELHKYMDICALARNKCAHDERFFDIDFRKGLHTKSIKNIDVLNLFRDQEGSYLSGTKDAYSIAIIVAIILDKNNINSFVLEIDQAFEQLKTKLHTIPVDNVMKIMGYNESWKNIIHLKQ